MALTVTGITLWVSEHISQLAADVYNMQRTLDLQFSSEYCNAYAYGRPGDALKLHEEIAKIGAQQLGIEHELYLTLWSKSRDVIAQYWDIPEEFRDVEKYEDE